ELVGINSQILPSQSGENIGIGFAIPSNMAKTVMDQLVKSGKVRRGQLGIRVTRVSSDMAANLEMPEAKGVIVDSVQPGSGADKAGLRQGDVITAINDNPVSDSNAFRNRVASNAPGTEVTLTVLRDKKEQKIRATLGEASEQTARSENENEGGPNSRSGGGKLGISVAPLTPDVAQELQLKAGTTGVVVESVDPTGPAAEANIQRGDVIQEVNRQPVRSADDLRAAMEKNGTKPALLLINERGETRFITIRPKQ
ncbi:MAG TPA: PDZ domain-containing protein, partial [Pyrinomonadaceae bacterium]|nr:PDZ domain-containing protein [Pyrinomonadaceae bacterium]